MKNSRQLRRDLRLLESAARQLLAGMHSQGEDADRRAPTWRVHHHDVEHLRLALQAVRETPDAEPTKPAEKP